MDEWMTPSDLAARLGVSERRGQQIAQVLESLGFAIQRDPYGGRRIPPALAEAVVRLREEGRPLRELLSLPGLEALKAKDPGLSVAEGLGEALLLVAQVRTALRALGRAQLPFWPPAWSWVERGLEAPRGEGR